MKCTNVYRWLILPLILLATSGVWFVNPVSAQDGTVVSISPSGQAVAPGNIFTVEITVDPKVAIAGIQFDLSFDSSLITVDTIEEGDLLNQNGASTYFTTGTIDNDAGTVAGVAGAITTPGQTVSSPGTFAIITFTAGTDGGTSPLDLLNVIVGNIEGNAVPIEVNGGSTTIGWWLDISVSFYQKEQDTYSAAASCKMILDYIRGDAILTQTELYDFGHASNAPENTDIAEIDPQGVKAILNNYKPEQYNFDIIAKTNVTDLMRDICHWMDYEVPGVTAQNTPTAVPAFGDYGNWMVVRGASASDDPSGSNSFTVYGLWLNDPAADGIGENSFKTASELESTYLLPLNTADTWNGKYVAVCEPPETFSETGTLIADVRITDSGKEFVRIVESQGGAQGSGQYKAMSISGAGDGGFSWQDIVDPSLLHDESFIKAFQDAIALTAIRVKDSTDGSSDYYLIPFVKRVDGQDLTSVVLIVDAAQGYFKEASWVSEPVDYPFVVKQEAIDLVLQKSGSQSEEIKAEMIWQPEKMPSSPYYPFWSVILDGEAWFVTVEEKVILGRAGNVNGDDKVNVLDMILIGQQWGAGGRRGWIPVDVKQDGRINVLDMIIVGQDWTG